MQNTFRSNLALSIFLILASLFIYFLLIPWQVGEPKNIGSVFLSPAFAPKFFSLCLGLLGLILLFQTIAKRRAASRQATQEHVAAKLQAVKSWNGEGVVIVTIAVCVVFIMSIKYLGMLIPSIIFLGGMMFYFGQRNWTVIVTVMVLFPLILYFFLNDMANIIIPGGSLFSLEGLR
jgi:hypothetical protein